MKKSLLLFTFLCILLGSAEIHAYTPAAKKASPLLIQPAANSTLDLCPRVLGFYQVMFNANNPQARKLSYKLFLNDPRQLLQEHVVTFASSAEATQNASVVLSNSIKPKQQYLIELKTLDAKGNMIKQEYFTFFTSDKNSESPLPQLISPADGATGVALKPTLQVKPFPATACGSGIESVYFAVDTYPADWQGSDMQSTTFAGGVYSWQVPNPLAPGTKYQVKVIFQAPGAVSSTNVLTSEYTFTTEASIIRESKPVLVTPAPDAPLVYCDLVPFVGISVNPNNAKARKVYITGIGSMDCCPDNGISLTPQQAMGTVGASFRIGYPNGSYSAYQLGEVRMKELKITTVDSLGNVLAENTYMVPTTGPNRKAPDFMSPLAGATDVSLTPMIQMEEYLANSCEHMAFISYEIDTYPADWQGSDYIKANVVSSASQWQCPTSLLSNTKYEVRVNYAFTGIGALSSVSQVFTTGSSSARAATSLVSTVLQESESVASPNPFAKELAVKLHPGYEKATITVISQQGQRLFTQESTGGQTIRFNADGLHSGIYLIRITDGRGHEENMKVIKQ